MNPGSFVNPIDSPECGITSQAESGTGLGSHKKPGSCTCGLSRGTVSCLEYTILIRCLVFNSILMPSQPSCMTEYGAGLLLHIGGHRQRDLRTSHTLYHLKAQYI